MGNKLATGDEISTLDGAVTDFTTKSVYVILQIHSCLYLATKFTYWWRWEVWVSKQPGDGIAQTAS